MAEKFKQETSAEKLDSFLTRNRKAILTIALIVVVAVIVATACVVVTAKNTEKGLAKVDAITYALIQNASALEGDALAARQDEALKQLVDYTGKGGIVGVRANMLAGDVYFQKQDYENAKTAWLKAAQAKKKAYTAPLCYYNAASCSEELNNNEDAAKYYEKAASSKDFILRSHALFNHARVKESLGNINEAQEVYQQLIDDYPYDSWANLAQSRLIALKAEGKIQ